MLNKMTKLFARFRFDDAGVTLVEYGIALTLAVALGTGALLALSGGIKKEMNAATTVLGGTPAP